MYADGCVVKQTKISFQYWKNVLHADLVATKMCGEVSLMNHSSKAALKVVRQETPISKHVPISHLNSATVFESGDGLVGSTIKIEGVPFETEKNEVLNEYKRSWHQALQNIPSEFSIYVTTHRHKINKDLTGEFPDDFSHELNEKYMEKFKDLAMYINDIYITIIYKGLTSGKAAKGINIFKKISRVVKHINEATLKAAKKQQRILNTKALNKCIKQLLTTLGKFNPALLGENDDKKGYSEVLEFFSLFFNGGEKIQLRQPENMPTINKTLKDAKKTSGIYPEGNIAQYLLAKRIFFGSNIQFQGNTDNDARFAAILSIKQYGTLSSSVMFDAFLLMETEFVCTHSFSIEEKSLTQGKIQQHMIKMQNVNDPATSQIEELHIARDDIASDRIKMGYHSNTLMLLADNQKSLEKNVQRASKLYSDSGFVAVRESLGMEPAFWSQVPCNQKYIIRSALISSENFVDFCPLHNYRTGYFGQTHLGSAVTLLETPSKTPYFFNFHAKGGSKDNFTKGHTLVIGGNGSGKTVFASFMDSQSSRYKGDTFFFDRDRGAEIYIRARGGLYSVLSPDFPENVCFNPLQMADIPSNRKFCSEWFSQLVKNEGESSLDAQTQEQIKNTIDYAFDELAHEHRTLSNTAKILPINFSRWPNLRRWLRGSGKYGDGEYAYVFDNEADRLQLNTIMGFDMTHFLDNEPSHVRTSLMMYLFQRIEQSLNGQLVRIILDEGWQYLDDVYWQNKLRRLLPTLRKKNAFIVLMTQSPSSVVDSPLRSMLLDNAATMIFFANPQARSEHYIDGFNLTETEFNIIKENSPETRLFIVKQEHESNLCKIDLSHIGELIPILSANTKNVLLLDKIRAERGDDPSQWMAEFKKRVRQ
jgi:type IV secretion system protein VirB4